MRSRTRRSLVFPILAALTVAGAGGGYKIKRESPDARAYPMPGQLVEFGGYRLHLHCTGSGSPTVVSEPGQGGVPQTCVDCAGRGRAACQAPFQA